MRKGSAFTEPLSRRGAYVGASSARRRGAIRDNWCGDRGGSTADVAVGARPSREADVAGTLGGGHARNWARRYAGGSTRPSAVAVTEAGRRCVGSCVLLRGELLGIALLEVAVLGLVPGRLGDIACLRGLRSVLLGEVQLEVAVD